MENLLSLFDTLAYYPTGFFMFFFCIFLFYWLVSLIFGLDQTLGFDIDIDLDLDDAGFLTSLFVTMGLSKVPLTIGLTFASFVGLFVSGLTQIHLLGLFYDFGNAEFNQFGLLYFTISTVVLIVSLFVSLWIAGIMVKPLVPIFNTDNKIQEFDYIGSLGKVRSAEVTDTFGDVKIENEDLEYVITVYKKEDSEEIVYGDQVKIIDYNEESKRYLVEKVY